MAQGVHPAMKGMQPTGPHPVRDRSAAEPLGHGLAPADDAVLALGEHDDPGRGALGIHVVQ